jgi:hypothetical protein
MAHPETYHGAMTNTPETLILVALVVVAGTTLFGATGFGASPITILVLARVLPLTFVRSLAALLDFTSGLAGHGRTAVKESRRRVSSERTSMAAVAPRPRSRP